MTQAAERGTIGRNNRTRGAQMLEILFCLAIAPVLFIINLLKMQ